MRQVLKRPIFTEKSSRIEGEGKYVFEVLPSANKIEIRRAIEERYHVNVTKVHTITVQPKRRELWTVRGLMSGKTAKRKKAIVTVAKGQTIDVVGELTGDV